MEVMLYIYSSGKFMLLRMFVNTNFMIAIYRKPVLWANIHVFEYAQLRADEIIKEKTEQMKILHNTWGMKLCFKFCSFGNHGKIIVLT